MTPEQALARARDAERLVNDPTVKETLSVIERDIYDAWLVCPIRDVEGREALWRMAVTARKFADTLKGTAEAGKLAAHNIRERQSFLDKAKQQVANWR